MLTKKVYLLNIPVPGITNDRQGCNPDIHVFFLYRYGVVPNRLSGKCLDPRIQGTSPGNSVCVEGELPKPSPVCPESPKEQQ